MRKLLRYEMMALSRGLLPLYGGVLVVALINRILGIFQQPTEVLAGIPLVISLMLYFGLIVGVGVMTLIVIVQRFYKGLLCDEGYLMFTLPVEPGKLIFSKLIGATLMTIVSVLVGVVSVLILTSYGPVFEGFLSVPWLDVFGNAFQQAPTWPLILIELVVLGVLSTAGGILELYLPMALGHQARRHRVAMSVVWFIAITTAMSTVSAIVASVASACGFDYYLSRLMYNLPGETGIHLTLLSWILGMLILYGLFYYAVRYLLTHRLNLE